MTKKQIRCKDVFEHVCENLDRDINSPECREFKRHMDQCPNCVAYLDGLTTITSDAGFRQQFQQFLAGNQTQAPAPAGALGSGSPAAPATTPTSPTSADAARLKELEDLIGDIAGELGAVLSLQGGQIVIANAKTAIVDKITALKQAGTSTDVTTFKSTTLKPAMEALESALSKGDTRIGGVVKFTKDDWSEVEAKKTALTALKA